MKRLLSAVLALALPAAAFAQEDARCALPGELVVEDASGDHQTAPAGLGFSDILTLHMAEPGDNTLVVTFKMADLAVLPPNTLWALRFLTDVPPEGADEYFVAMLTDPAGMPHFVHGTAAPADGSGGAAPLLFAPAGALGAASGFDADGTITLALDKTQVGGLTAGGFIFSMIPIVHRITPTDGSLPFAYGFRSAGGVLLPYDDAGDGIYEVAGEEVCGAGGKSGILGAGALNVLPLLALGLLALARRRTA